MHLWRWTHRCVRASTTKHPLNVFSYLFSLRQRTWFILKSIHVMAQTLDSITKPMVTNSHTVHHFLYEHSLVGFFFLYSWWVNQKSFCHGECLHAPDVTIYRYKKNKQHRHKFYCWNVVGQFDIACRIMNKSPCIFPKRHFQYYMQSQCI